MAYNPYAGVNTNNMSQDDWLAIIRTATGTSDNAAASNFLNDNPSDNNKWGDLSRSITKQLGYGGRFGTDALAKIAELMKNAGNLGNLELSLAGQPLSSTPGSTTSNYLASMLSRYFGGGGSMEKVMEGMAPGRREGANDVVALMNQMYTMADATRRGPTAHGFSDAGQAKAQYDNKGNLYAIQYLANQLYGNQAAQEGFGSAFTGLTGRDNPWENYGSESDFDAWRNSKRRKPVNAWNPPQ